ncbi:MAG: hypothetical protein ABIJ14_01110 [Nanoarchaeota archaeon]
MTEQRKTTSIKISPKLWEEVKINCIRQKKDISVYLEELIRKDLKR